MRNDSLKSKIEKLQYQASQLLNEVLYNCTGKRRGFLRGKGFYKSQGKKAHG